MARFDRAADNSWHQQLSGAPSFTTASASLSLSGFEDFSALSDPAIYEAASFSGGPQNYTPTQSPPNVDAFAGYPANVQHSLSSAPFRSSQNTQYPYYAEPNHSRRTPRSPTSPRLRTANSLNFPPLYSGELPLGSPPALVSPNSGYFPAPSDVPYAESAASSTYSLAEDEEPFPQIAEDEKRKRNLAASARFRQKKKLREQQLEKTTKDLTDRADELEARIKELEEENKLLKALLTEKVETMTEEDLVRFDEVASQFED